MEYLSWTARSKEDYKYAHQIHCICCTNSLYSTPLYTVLSHSLNLWHQSSSLSACLLQGHRRDLWCSPWLWWLLFELWIKAHRVSVKLPVLYIARLLGVEAIRTPNAELLKLVHVCHTRYALNQDVCVLLHSYQWPCPEQREKEPQLAVLI